MGGHVRVGLEDNLRFDRLRTIPADNESLVRRVVDIAAALERAPATPDAARETIGLRPRALIDTLAGRHA